MDDAHMIEVKKVRGATVHTEPLQRSSSNFDGENEEATKGGEVEEPGAAQGLTEKKLNGYPDWC